MPILWDEIFTVLILRFGDYDEAVAAANELERIFSGEKADAVEEALANARKRVNGIMDNYDFEGADSLYINGFYEAIDEAIKNI